jgi:serine/threonine-protein kinase
VALRSVVPLPDGREALVFDHVDGVGLAAMVKARGHLRPGEVVTVLTPVCDAVATLHRAGGLHGDISPSNVRLTPDGRPVLLDLGAARVAGSDDERVYGTSGFVAPEVAAGWPPSESSDVYALGALAWFCATGNGAPDTMLRLDRETVASHVGEQLADAIGACIDPDPLERPSSEGLARLFYEAAPADPVEVVVGTDVASALTHRLRAQAREDDQPAAAADRWWRRLVGRSGATVAPAAASAGGVRRPVVAAVGAGLVAVAASGWAVAAVASSGGQAREPVPDVVAAQAPARRVASAPRQTDAPAPPAATSAAAGTTGAPAHRAPDRMMLLRSPTAPSEHASDLLQALGDARSRALVERDVAALAAVHRSGGPSWSTDRHLLEALRSAGVRWEGLRLQVARATFVAGSSSGGGPDGPTAAVVRARVDWTAYTVVTQTGARVAQAAQEGDLLDFRLVRGADGWRIDRISRAPAS